MQRRLAILVLILIGAGVAYVYRAPVSVFATQLYSDVAPCSEPLTYSIGTIDPRFHVSQSDAESALASAAHIWDTVSARNLFSYVPTGGTVTVNFVYDDRQKTTEKLRSLGLHISSDKASYDTLNVAYKSLLGSYTAEKSAFDAHNTALERDLAVYQNEVQRVNARGGATPTEFETLQSEKAALTQREDALKSEQVRVNADADDINAMVTTLNRLAVLVNTDASVYNNTANGGAEEFEEAVFESAPGHETITVYQFDTENQLVRVLAHELGHALGLEHVDDKSAIMYRLNQSTNSIPTKADIKELHAACRTT